MFQSLNFWLFLLTAVVLFWQLPRSLRLGFLAMVSVGYIAYLDWQSCLSLLLISLSTFLLARARLSNERWQFCKTTANVLGILSFLFYHKYIPTLLDSLNGAASVEQVLIPLGISFYSFKLIHYAVEMHRGNISEHHLGSFLCYIFVFPIFSAGPIERFEHFLDERVGPWQTDHAVHGITRIIHGLIKKFVLAALLNPANFGTIDSVPALLERLPEIATWKLWIYMMLSFLVTYFDFSAYSDLAIGTSRLFGLRIMENFNFPLLAKNVGDYWKRWHMTLGAWCQSYVYMPLIGLTRNPYLAVYATFFTIGIWHAGTMQRVLWGLYHGTGVAVSLSWGRVKRKRRWNALDRGLAQYVGIPITFLFVSASMAFICVEGHGDYYDSLRVAAKLFFVNLPE